MSATNRTALIPTPIDACRAAQAVRASAAIRDAFRMSLPQTTQGMCELFTSQFCAMLQPHLPMALADGLRLVRVARGVAASPEEAAVPYDHAIPVLSVVAPSGKLTLVVVDGTWGQFFPDGPKWDVVIEPRATFDAKNGGFRTTVATPQKNRPSYGATGPNADSQHPSAYYNVPETRLHGPKWDRRHRRQQRPRHQLAACSIM